MPNLSTLRALTPREAVADALHRCVLGIDTDNKELFESACLKNDNMTVVAGPFVAEGWTAITEGWTAITEGWTAITEMFQKAFVLVTTHITSNIRIEMKDGADTASMTTHALSYHVRLDDTLKPEGTSYTAASLYSIDLVKDVDDGLWKFKKWEMRILWTTGDKAILHG